MKKNEMFYLFFFLIICKSKQINSYKRICKNKTFSIKIIYIFPILNNLDFKIVLLSLLFSMS